MLLLKQTGICIREDSKNVKKGLSVLFRLIRILFYKWRNEYFAENSLQNQAKKEKVKL